jgi:predicted SprT family Zn-dependent metalloprotease
VKLPDMLTEHAEEFKAVLQTPMLGEWTKGEAYANAGQPAAIAELLIPMLHEELQSAKIAYLFRENISHGDRVRLGVASKAGGKIHFLSDIDFCIDFNWTAWRRLDGAARIALVDHELTHCTLDDGEWMMRHHDVEEFGEIVRRWGVWKPDLREFAKDMKGAIAQADLFDAAREFRDNIPAGHSVTIESPGSAPVTIQR